MRTRTSAPFFVSRVGRGISSPGLAPGAAATCGPTGPGEGSHAGHRLQFDALMGIGHDLFPGHGRQRAAGHAVGRRIIVVSEPDRCDHVAGIAGEPGVAIGVGGAGLAGRPDAIEHGAAAGAFLDCLVQDHVDVGGNRLRHHAARLRAVPVESPHQVAGRAADFEDGVRRHRHAAIREGGEGAGMIEHRDLVRADRQRRRIGQRGAHAHLLGEFDDLVAAGARIAIADHDREPDRDGVDRSAPARWSASAIRNSRPNNCAGTNCRCRSARRPPPWLASGRG